jgi:hypothetical protein
MHWRTISGLLTGKLEAESWVVAEMWRFETSAAIIGRKESLPLPKGTHAKLSK